MTKENKRRRKKVIITAMIYIKIKTRQYKTSITTKAKAKSMHTVKDKTTIQDQLNNKRKDNTKQEKARHEKP